MPLSNRDAAASTYGRVTGALRAVRIAGVGP